MKMNFVRLLAVVAAFCALATLASAQDLIYNGNGFGQIPIFENQVNVKSAVIDTYFGMIANDWGYGGIQMNDTTSTRRVIFSIWDQTTSTGAEESTTIAYNSALDIYRVGRFGGEGTGAQFLANYPWAYGTTTGSHTGCLPSRMERMCASTVSSTTRVWAHGPTA